MITKEELVKESNSLLLCPFCGGKAEFSLMSDGVRLHIHHFPDPGINCPARFEQFCETFDQGRGWWNKRVT